MIGKSLRLGPVLITMLALATPVTGIAAEKKTVLVFSLTKGFRHGGAIKTGNPIIKRIAEDLGCECVVSEDPAVFNPDKVKQWDCFVFNNTTGDLFSEPERRKAFMNQIKSGAGFMGFHAATDCFYNFPEYGAMINGWFSGHPWNQKVTARIEEPDHPLMKPFGGASWEVKDEIYQFRNFDRSAVHMLMSIDPRSVDINRGKRKDRYYGLCWIRKWEQGRVFYSAHGHYGHVFENPKFQEHIKVAFKWALGEIEVDTTPTEVEDPAVVAARALKKLKTARNDEDREAALMVLSWSTTKDALPLVTPMLEASNKLAESAAAVAAATIEASPDIPGKQKISTLKKALDCTANRGTRRSIRKQLTDLGVTDIPIRVPPGFISHWWVSGPFPNKNSAMFDKTYPPETGVDVSETFKAGGKTMEWKKALTNEDGILNLKNATNGGNNQGAYMFAELTVEKATPVELRLGSDDGFVLWLNGKRLAGKNVSRGIKPGSDRVKAKLIAGANKILTKVINGGGDWAGCLQVVAPDGTKIDFDQRKK